MVGPTRMELIACDKRRHLTFQGRVKSMKKKAYELSTLCGLDIGMIICSPSGQEIETLSWSNQQDDDAAAAGRNTLLDLIARYKNQDGNKSKKTTLFSGISNKKKETQKTAAAAVACESSELDLKSEKELGESAMCLDTKIERVKARIEHLKKQEQPQAADDFIQDYGTMDDDDLVFLLDRIIDEPLTPIQEEDSSSASATFASVNDKACHSNIPSVMTTGGYPMTSQVMIGRAAFQDFTYNTYLNDAPQYTNDQFSYNPYPWTTY